MAVQNVNYAFGALYVMCVISAVLSYIVTKRRLYQVRQSAHVHQKIEFDKKVASAGV